MVGRSQRCPARAAVIAAVATACAPHPPPEPGPPEVPTLASVSGVGDAMVVDAGGDRCVLAIGLLARQSDPRDHDIDRTVLAVSEDAGESWRITREVVGATVAFVPRPGDGAWLLTARASGEGSSYALYRLDAQVAELRHDDAIDRFLHDNGWHYDVMSSDLRVGPDGLVAVALGNDRGWAVSIDDGASWTAAGAAPPAANGASLALDGPCRVSGASPWLVQRSTGGAWIDVVVLR